MPDQLIILEPVDDNAEVAVSYVASRPTSLTGVRLGVLDNGKPNSDRLLRMIVDRLCADHAIDDVVWIRKPSIGRLAPAETLVELATGCDVVVTGVGDCAGCCSCTVGDAVALERTGTPVAAVCTTEFLTTAKIAAAAAGAPGYPVAVIGHPLGSLSAAELADRARDIGTGITDLLVGDPVPGYRGASA